MEEVKEAAAGPPLSLLTMFSLLWELSHGYANLADTSTGVATYLFVPGVAVAGIALVMVFAAIAASRIAPWQRAAIRVIGSWIAAIGTLIIGVA